MVKSSPVQTEAAIQQKASGECRPDILMLCLDAVRADYLGGPDIPPLTTPWIRKLASRGIFFTHCYAPATWTLPSFGTLFTGLYPSEHGADRYQAYFSPPVPTLAEQLASFYETVCVSYNPYLNDRFNLTRGFKITYTFGRYVPRFYTYRRRYAGWRKFAELIGLMLRQGRLTQNFAQMIGHLTSTWASRKIPDQGATRNNHIITQWFATQQRRPLLVVANYMEAHWPYFFDPTAGLLSSREAQSIYHKLANTFPFGPITGRVQLMPAERQALAALYASAVHYLDQKIGELLEMLAHIGALDNTYVMIFADHGEMLGEQGLYGHTLTLHNRVLHVPLLLIPPTGHHAPQVVTKPFRLQDLREIVLLLAGGQASTLTAYLDQYPDKQSIYAEYAGHQDRLTPEDEQFLRNSPHLGGRLVALIEGQTKYVLSSQGFEALYNLVQDPDEERNLITTIPDIAQAMRTKLCDFQKGLVPSESPKHLVPDEALKKRLRALGYL